MCLVERRGRNQRFHLREHRAKLSDSLSLIHLGSCQGKRIKKINQPPTFWDRVASNFLPERAVSKSCTPKMCRRNPLVSQGSTYKRWDQESAHFEPHLVIPLAHFFVFFQSFFLFFAQYSVHLEGAPGMRPSTRFMFCTAVFCKFVLFFVAAYWLVSENALYSARRRQRARQVRPTFFVLLSICKSGNFWGLWCDFQLAMPFWCSHVHTTHRRKSEGLCSHKMPRPLDFSTSRQFSACEIA